MYFSINLINTCISYLYKYGLRLHLSLYDCFNFHFWMAHTIIGVMPLYLPQVVSVNYELYWYLEFSFFCRKSLEAKAKLYEKIAHGSEIPGMLTVVGFIVNTLYIFQMMLWVWYFLTEIVLFKSS